MLKKFALIVGCVVVSGCSSIVEGRSQEIVVNTNPSGATCILERNGTPIGTVAPTPSAVLIQKTKYDILIRCNKDGYEEATYFNKSGAAGATFGNIVLGGGIGWAIDSATGSDNKYDSPVNLSMVPEMRTMASKKKKSEPREMVEAAPVKPKPSVTARKAEEDSEEDIAEVEVEQTTPKQTATVSQYPTGKKNWARTTQQ